MKQLYSIATALFLLVLPHLNVQAQEVGVRKIDWSPEIYQPGKLYPGYIIQLNGDTTKGFLKALQRCAPGGLGNGNQNTAEFYLHESDKKPTGKYDPSEIKGYLIADKLYESIAFSGGLLKKPNFNLVQVDGGIRIYYWYSTVENFSAIQKQSGETWEAFDARRYETKTVVGKPGLDPLEYNSLAMSFAKKMPDFVSDNAAMAKKITDKEKGYKSLDIFNVIDEYNTWKAGQ